MNYKKVIEDFRSGVINKDEWQLIMDNDCGHWLYIGNEFNDLEEYDYDNALENVGKKMSEKYGEPNGPDDIVEVLIAAGVTAEWC